MKYLLMTLAVIAFLAVPVLASDQGTLSRNDLSKLGLSGMTVMSDAQGTAVRGMGFSVAYGKSVAGVPGAYSTNGYLAVDSGNKGSLAGGANISVAGFALGGCNCVTWGVVGAGGASIAFTK
jgi:hypothetical protein